MSNVSSSISTPGEARQARRIVLACDLAFLGQMIVLLAIALPMAFLFFRSYLPGYALQLLMGRLGMAIFAWLTTAASLLGIAAAILLLGAPRHMRCFGESCIYAGLVIAHALVTASGRFITPPAYLLVANQLAALVLTPIALLLVLRKIALFLESPTDTNKTYHAFRLLMIGIALIVLGQAAARFANQSITDPLTTILITAGLIGSGICAIVLVSVRLFGLNLSVRRQLRGKLEMYQQLLRSADSSSQLAVAGQTSAVPASAGLGRFIAWALAVVLVFVVCEGGLYQQRSVELYKKREDQEAQARYQEESKQASQFNNELWERVRSPQATLRNDDIMKMGAICKKFPSAAFYNTLGVAHYRSGSYDAAEQFLKMSAAWRGGIPKARGGGPEPGDIAFLAMCSYKLGRHEKANAYREQFEKLMEQDQFNQDENYRAFQQEVTALFGVR